MIKTLNKWLAKFDKRIVSKGEYNAMQEEHDGLMAAIINMGNGALTEPRVTKSINFFSVWAKKGVISTLCGIFSFDPKSEESIEYAKVCAEDLADAIREAEQYEPIK